MPQGTPMQHNHKNKISLEKKPSLSKKKKNKNKNEKILAYFSQPKSEKTWAFFSLVDLFSEVTILTSLNHTIFSVKKRSKSLLFTN
jgi:hypothetical protein